MPRRRPRCAFTSFLHGRCPNPGTGDPPLCPEHDDEFSDTSNELIDSLLDHPAIQNVLGKVGGVLDLASNFIQKAPEYVKNIKVPHNTQQSRPQRPQPVEDPRKVLGFDPSTVLTVDIVKQRQRDLARIFHPDTGTAGSTAAMARVNAAVDFLLKQL